MPQSVSQNTLILSSQTGSQHESYLENVTVTPETETTVLLVQYADQHETGEWMNAWMDYVTGSPPELHTIRIAPRTQSTSTLEQDTQDSAAETVYKTISSPRNLTEVGVTISEFFEDHLNDTQTGQSREVVVIFDSLTTLLQHVDLQHAFKFLHVLSARFETTDVTGYYVLDQAVHDIETVETLRVLFDAVIDEASTGNTPPSA